MGVTLRQVGQVASGGASGGRSSQRLTRKGWRPLLPPEDWVPALAVPVTGTTLAWHLNNEEDPREALLPQRTGGYPDIPVRRASGERLRF